MATSKTSEEEAKKIGGMFAVSPKKDCPHVQPLVASIEDMKIDMSIPCATCENVGENWLCLKCSEVFCSRYVNSHMVDHNTQEHSHMITLSFSDLSFWCYECDSYIESSHLDPIFKAASIAKFDSPSKKFNSQTEALTSKDKESKVQCNSQPVAQSDTRASTVKNEDSEDQSSNTGKEENPKSFQLESTLPQDVLLSRMRAVIYGNCIGDAIGLLTEFMTKEEAKEIYGTVEKGKWFGFRTSKEEIEYPQLEYKMKYDDYHRSRWEVGDWTDDSDQMILILRTLLEKHGKADILDFVQKFKVWTETGYEELGDIGGMGIGQTTFEVILQRDFFKDPHKADCIDFAARFKEWVRHGYSELKDERGYGIGGLTRSVLSHIHFLTDPNKCAKQVWIDSGKWAAPNGGVMRTSILGIQDFGHIQTVIDNTRQICKVTHADPRCIASCVAVTTAIALMLQGKYRKEGSDFEYDVPKICEEAYDYACKELETPDEKEELHRHMFAKSLADLELSGNRKIGYTYKCLGAGFWAFRHEDFRRALTDLVMEAGDADTNGAVAGALLGCKLGVEKLPVSWLEDLLHKDWLDKQIDRYFDMLGFSGFCQEQEKSK